MAEFFVDRAENAENTRLLHKKNCADIANDETHRYLGSYATVSAAHKKATGYYHKVDNCPKCAS